MFFFYKYFCFCGLFCGGGVRKIRRNNEVNIYEVIGVKEENKRRCGRGYVKGFYFK